MSVPSVHSLEERGSGTIRENPTPINISNPKFVIITDLIQRETDPVVKVKLAEALIAQINSDTPKKINDHRKPKTIPSSTKSHQKSIIADPYWSILWPFGWFGQSDRFGEYEELKPHFY